jgi:branched-chain amino acid transport system permease protein
MFCMDLNFISIAMFVFGGASSATGAVAGVVVIAPVTEILRDGVAGVQLGSTMVALPRGAQEIGLRIIMGLVLIFRTRGRSLGRELPSPFREM